MDPYRARPLNLPNLITISRIALAPIFVTVLLSNSSAAGWQRWLVVGLFVLAIATDGIDGAIARKRGQVTELGKLLDPIADKVLIGGSLIALSILGEIAWWITLLILLREVGITVYRFLHLKNRVIPASGGGKLKTILQSIAVGFYLSPLSSLWNGFFIIQSGILWAALFLTVYSGVQYLVAAKA